MTEANEPDFFQQIDPLMDKALKALGEHADSVLIIVTRHDFVKNETWSQTQTHGNRYACQAAAQDWITRKEENVREQERIRSRDDDDDS